MFIIYKKMYIPVHRGSSGLVIQKRKINGSGLKVFSSRRKLKDNKTVQFPERNPMVLQSKTVPTIPSIAGSGINQLSNKLNNLSLRPKKNNIKFII